MFADPWEVDQVDQQNRTISLSCIWTSSLCKYLWVQYTSYKYNRNNQMRMNNKSAWWMIIEVESCLIIMFGGNGCAKCALLTEEYKLQKHQHQRSSRDSIYPPHSGDAYWPKHADKALSSSQLNDVLIKYGKVYVGKRLRRMWWMLCSCKPFEWAWRRRRCFLNGENAVFATIYRHKQINRDDDD